MIRFAVIRVPSSGPPALAGPPDAFETKADALARIAEIEAEHRKSHQTYLDVVSFEGPLEISLSVKGILL